MCKPLEMQPWGLRTLYLSDLQAFFGALLGYFLVNSFLAWMYSHHASASSTFRDIIKLPACSAT